MRVIDFQDGLYRSQPTEKVQSRIVNQPADNVQLAQLKQLQEVASRQAQIAESEKTQDKLVNKDKEEREKGKNKKRDKKGAESPLSQKKPRRPTDGHIIDIDA